MSNHVGVRITVLEPAVAETATARTATCRFAAESTRELPRAHAGTVRVGALETLPSGAHPCRLLKHYAVERDAYDIAADPGRATYRVTIDLSDESVAQGAVYLAPGCGVRRPNEPVQEVCRRVAGVFARYCEQYRPPSIRIELGDA